MVDDSDFERVSQFKWCVTFNNGKWYAIRGFLGKKLYLHHFIFGDKGLDHIDGNSLNNQRSNLRKATQSQNLTNRKPMSKSGLKGVYFWEERGVFQCKFGNKTLGYFDDAKKAAMAYDAAALEKFGSFALTNQQMGLI